MTKLKVSFVEFPQKVHEWKRLGHVIVHDAAADISLHTFDLRYLGPRSRLGKHLRELQANGVDISAYENMNHFKTKRSGLKKKPDDLTVTIAKRLYTSLVKRTIVHGTTKKGGKTTTTKNDESFDWNRSDVVNSKYYKMAERIIKENDALKIVNIITGYA